MTTGPGEHPSPAEVDLLLDDEGDPGLRRHVDGCAHCQDVLERQRTVRALLSAQAAHPPLPSEVSDRWLRAVAAEPAFGVPPHTGPLAARPDPGGDGFGPPDFGAWPADVAPTADDGNHRARGTGPATWRPDTTPGPTDPDVISRRAAGHPRATHRRAGRGPTDPDRLRRLRMAVALAAGLTVLVGAGAATWTAYTRQAPSSSAAEAPAPSAFDESAEGSAGDMASRSSRAASPEAPADSAPRSSDPADGSASTAGAATLSADQVREAVATDDLRWAGASSPDEARTRAVECLRGLGTEGPVLATRPATRDGGPIQVIVSAEERGWRVTEVTPDCPADGAVTSTHLTP